MWFILFSPRTLQFQELHSVNERYDSESCQFPITCTTDVVDTKCHSLVVTTAASYSGGPRFKSQSGDWPSCLRFIMIFLSPSTHARVILKLGHDCFLPHPTHFIIYLSSYCLTAYSLELPTLCKSEVNRPK
jgi:hypothetical protein